MKLDPPREPLDLLVVGGLTIDRLTDDSLAPGGSVIHIARAGAAAGVRLGVVTAAGPEPEATQALAELRRLATVVDSTPGAATIRYRHVESQDGRRLWLEHKGPMVTVPAGASSTLQAAAILFTPVAGEIGTDLLATLPARSRGAILQGWLRTIDEGESRTVPLASLRPALVEKLAGMALLTASREDLRGEGGEPAAQLLALRGWIGPAPLLVVTDGVEGAWVDDGSGPQHLPVPRRVDGVPSIGAGDVFAAFTLLALTAQDISPRAAAVSGMRAVIEMLEARVGEC